MDSIIILDDDEEEEKSKPSSSISLHRTADKTRKNIPTPVATHITQSPFASAKKDRNVLQKENEKLFSEFVEHCRAHTTDCPEVLTFLQTKHAKASPDFLSSIEFRNSLGRCLTRARASTAKTFVFINELCTVLKQHSTKRRTTTQVVPSTEEKAQKGTEGEMNSGSPAEVTPSTSGAQGEDGNEEEGDKKTKRASRRQIAYLENLLKVYSDEIKRLQEKELSMDELEEEDSSYMQEHKLKRKMMKIYDKLCELKSCNTLTGRVIEQKVSYKGTRYPEINKKIERYINSPEVRWNPPDYRDILQLVQHVNQRQNLSLSRSQLSQIAQDAFQETGSRLQDRRHLDMVFNFGSHLTDAYKPNTDPALSDSTLARKLRKNREVALSSLEEVITKYAMKQGDTEEEERKKRQKANQNKEDMDKAEEKEEEEEKGEESGEEEDDEEDEEDDVSSDPDIEEEIQASHSQEGDEGEEENEEPPNPSDGENQGSDDVPSVKSSVVEEEEEEEGGEEEGNSDNDQQSESSSHRGASTDASPSEQPTTENPSPSDSPSQSEPAKTNQWQSPISPSEPITTNSNSLPPSPVVVSTNQDLLLTSCETKSTNGRASPQSPVGSDSDCNFRKRRRSIEVVPQTTAIKRQKANSISDSESDIPLDMGVTSSPLQADSTRADSPTQEMVSSSQMTPPTKPNKVDAATQCDPEEVIVLSDSD